MPRLSTALRGALLCAALLVLLPDPRSFEADPAPALPELLDPALRVPFAAVLLRAPGAQLAPGARVLGLHRDGEAGIVAPRDRSALLRALAESPDAARFALDVQGPRGSRRLDATVRRTRAATDLAMQWPALVSACVFLLFALACLLGGRHPVATPLFAVSLCLGCGIGAALGLVLPADAGLLGLASARARLGLLAWCALPAALLHLAARFPVVVPSFRRPASIALPYALWALPALVAQLRFGEPAAVDAVERLALAASFLAGGILAIACAFPGRRLTPVERTRAGAARVGLAAAGLGPLWLFVRARQPDPTEASLVALASLALPLALGWAVARHRLLDPPGWLRRGIVSAATAVLAVLVAAAATSAAWKAAKPDGDAAPPASLALATVFAYQGVRSIATRWIVPSLLADAGATERLLARAARELAGLAAPNDVLRRLRALLEAELRPGGIAIFPDDVVPSSLLAQRGARLGHGPLGLVRAPRSEDPDPERPEVVVTLAPRATAAIRIVLAPRADGVPYASEELLALEDLARLATLALGDAAASAELEARVGARTELLVRAIADRSAVVEAAARIQGATRACDVRAAVESFLHSVTGIAPARVDPRRSEAVVVALDPARRDCIGVTGLDALRRADLAPQAEAVTVLACLALARIELLLDLESEVERQAQEIARDASNRQRAALAREVAHELRKPTEEICELAASAAGSSACAADPLFGRIELVARDLLRRLDCLLVRGGLRLDLRPLDLVRVVEASLDRVTRLRGARALSTHHARPRLPLVADPVRIASLVENLLDNAWKATAVAGGIALRTDLVASSGGPRVRLEVEDGGDGIAPELGDEIFEPGVSRFGQGFGLGLGLCRDAVAAHGGTIEVESAPGRTVFRVQLPQLGPDAEASA